MDEMMPRILSGIEVTVQGLQKSLQETTGVTNQLLAYLDNPEGDMKIAMRDLKGTLADIHVQVPKLLEQLDGSMRNIEQSTLLLRDTLKQASPDLIATVRRAQDDVKDIHDVVDSAKKVWPLSGHLPEEAPVVLVPPSLPSAPTSAGAKPSP
jgi:ABC-type transporter Mla subunit MlaD